MGAGSPQYTPTPAPIKMIAFNTYACGIRPRPSRTSFPALPQGSTAIESNEPHMLYGDICNYNDIYGTQFN